MRAMGAPAASCRCFFCTPPRGPRPAPHSAGLRPLPLLPLLPREVAGCGGGAASGGPSSAWTCCACCCCCGAGPSCRPATAAAASPPRLAAAAQALALLPSLPLLVLLVQGHAAWVRLEAVSRLAAGSGMPLLCWPPPAGQELHGRGAAQQGRERVLPPRLLAASWRVDRGWAQAGGGNTQGKVLSEGQHRCAQHYPPGEVGWPERDATEGSPYRQQRGSRAGS